MPVVLEAGLHPVPVLESRFHSQKHRGDHIGVLGERDGDRLNLGAKILEHSGCVDHRFPDLRLHLLVVEQFGEDADPRTLYITVEPLMVIGNWCLPAVWVFGIVAGNGPQGDGRVRHGAGDGTDRVHGPHPGHQTISTHPAPARS